MQQNIRLLRCRIPTLQLLLDIGSSISTAATSTRYLVRKLLDLAFITLTSNILCASSTTGLRLAAASTRLGMI